MQQWYLEDAYLTRKEARVLSCASAEEGLFEVALDGSIFAPEAGGQSADTGYLGGLALSGIRQKDGRTLYLIPEALEEGSPVELELDWERRFDHMQQHTGEHLFSGLAFKLYGAKNVGFHMADAYSTIDLDIPLSPEQLQRVEDETNACLWKNIPVTVENYDSLEALEGAPLRKQAEGLTPPIRVVRIGSEDACTCCAPHCRQTGEVGILMITDAAAYKGGVRISFLCGKRALQYARGVHQGMDRIARSFSTGREQAEEAVLRQGNELSSARRQLKEMAAVLNGYIAADLGRKTVQAGKVRVLSCLLEQVSADRLSGIALLICAQAPTACVLMSAAGQRLYYAAATSEGLSPDAGELIGAVNAATGGRGGGRGTRAQGVSGTTAYAGQVSSQLQDYLVSRYK